LVDLRPSKKQPFEKHLNLKKKRKKRKEKQLYVREIHLLIWRHQLEGWETAEMLPRNGGTGGCHAALPT